MLISLKNITVEYNNHKILNNVSIDIGENEFITIVGPNGAGKTTLLKVILGLTKPNEGSIKKNHKIKIGYTPQHINHNYFLPITVKNFLELNKKSEKAQLDEVINETNISKLLNKQLFELSGGEIQRVLLARSLTNIPDLLVLDEPTQNLDFNSQFSMYKAIENIHKKYNCSVIIVSHDLHFVMSNTQRVICLYHHICCSGKPDLITKNPKFIEVFGTEITDILSVYNHHHNHNHKH